jgi:hypothetical protein
LITASTVKLAIRIHQTQQIQLLEGLSSGSLMMVGSVLTLESHLTVKLTTQELMKVETKKVPVKDSTSSTPSTLLTLRKSVYLSEVRESVEATCSAS